MSFSGIVQISNISDFIEPSQKCILPIERKTTQNQRLVGVHLQSVLSRSNKIKISLNDCLACSGCVSTAETVLIESQTTKQMFAGIETSKYSIVAISPQSLCSLAAKFNMSISEMAKLLVHFFKSKRVNFVVDLSFARILSRSLLYKEFCHEFLSLDLGQDVYKRKTIFTGVCPGFVCYAEKINGDLLVPLLSTIRSPQAIMGKLVKNFFREKLSAQIEDIFLICVQPCFDKKLEAFRPDFKLGKRQEVDCVVTTLELESLLAEFIAKFEFDIKTQHMRLLPEFEWLHSFENGIILGDHDMETSGGYTEYIVRQLINEHGGMLINRERISKDFERLDIEIDDQNQQRHCLSLGKAYGFRNIQNLVQRIKRDKLRMHFVEVMACPSGCANGGGQIRAQKEEMRNQLQTKVRENYAELGSDEQQHKQQWAQIEENWSKLEPYWQDTLMHAVYRPLKSTNKTANIVNNW